MTSTQTDPWLLRLSALEIGCASWIVVAQFFTAFVEGEPLTAGRILLSTAGLVCYGAISLAVMRCPESASKTRYVLLAAQTLCFVLASFCGSTYGYGLLLLTFLAKTGLVISFRFWLLLSGIVLFPYLVITNFNSELLVQGSRGFENSGGSVLGILFGRDLIPMILGSLLVGFLVRFVMSEREHTRTLVQLTASLEALSTELERLRIVKELKASVDDKLLAVENRTRSVRSGQVAVEEEEEVLSQTRDLADEALTEIRRALKLLRD